MAKLKCKVHGTHNYACFQETEVWIDGPSAWGGHAAAKADFVDECQRILGPTWEVTWVEVCRS